MLVLKQYFIEEIMLDANMEKFKRPEGNQRRASCEQTPAFFKSLGDNNDYKVELKIVINMQDTDFSLKLKISGIFTSDDKKERDAEITNAAPSVLLGIVRDFVQTITSKTLYGSMTLPLTFFPVLSLDNKQMEEARTK